jgi:hypothetical protein
VAGLRLTHDAVASPLQRQRRIPTFCISNTTPRQQQHSIFENTTGAIIMRITAGSTTPGSTPWQQYNTNGIYVDVDTSSSGFADVPSYTASIGGTAWHWTTTGANAIYRATRNGFRVYIHQEGTAITPAMANSRRWHINWIGMGD